MKTRLALIFAIIAAVLVLYSANTQLARYKAALEERDQILMALRQKIVDMPKADDIQAKLDETKTQLNACIQEKNALMLRETKSTQAQRQTPKTEGDETMACVMAQRLITQYIVNNRNFAEKHIKFPSGSCFETVKKLSDGTFQFHGTVQYKNAFNADMESPVSAIVKPIGRDEWQLISIEFKK